MLPSPSRRIHRRAGAQPPIGNGRRRALLAQQQAQQAQSAKAKGCNQIASLLSSQGWAIPGGPRAQNIGLGKLYDGDTIKVTTKNKKEINVKFERGVVKQS